MTVCLYHCIALSGADWMCCGKREGISVDRSCKGRVSGSPSKFVWYKLLPDSSRNGVSKCASDIVCCEIDACNYSDIFEGLAHIPTTFVAKHLRSCLVAA
jgi:hypothetical protein